jgi:nitrogen-specific signal transduction histidine kinase
VLLLNEEAHKFFHAPKEKIVGRQIESLFTDKKKYEKLYEEVVENGMEIERYAADLVDPLGEKIPSLINANKVRDSFGVTLGVVYVIRDVRG